MNSTSLSTPPVMVSAAQSEPWDIVEVPPLLDFKDLASIIKRRFWWLIAIPFVCVVLTIVYLYTLAVPLYSSSALIYVDPKFEKTLQIENVQSSSSDLDSLNSLEKAITSDTMIIRVVNKLNLREEPDFMPKSLRKRIAEGKTVSDSRLLSSIRDKRVSASLIRPTRLLKLTILDPDPDRAKLIAETFVSEFELFLGEQKRDEAGISEKGLRVQADLAYKRALESEKQLEDFRSSNPEFTVEQDHELFAERLSKVGQDLNSATARVLDLKSRVGTLESIDPEIEPIRVIEAGGFSGLKQVSDIVAQRTAANSNFAIAKSRYTDSHPSFIQARLQVENADKELKSLATELKAALGSSLDAAEYNERLLKAEVSELQGVLSKVKSASSKFRAIQQKVETEWLVHQNLQAKIGETSLSTEKSTAITSVMSAPMVAYKPAKPGKAISVLIAGFLGSFLSVGIVGVDLLRGRPYVDGRQAEEHLNVKTIARIPAPGAGSENDQQLMSELSKVFYSPEHRQARFVHVSSVSECQEGLRTSACLAAVSARHGCSTLLISVLAGTNSNELVSFVPRESNTENLYTLTLTADFLVAPNSAWQLIGPHCQNFQRIVIESTAVSQDSQVPAVLTSFADSNLLIVSTERDTRNDTKHVVTRLAECARAPLSLIMQG